VPDDIIIEESNHSESRLGMKLPYNMKELSIVVGIAVDSVEIVIIVVFHSVLSKPYSM
jgi:hypothetical protein